MVFLVEMPVASQFVNPITSILRVALLFPVSRLDMETEVIKTKPNSSMLSEKKQQLELRHSEKARL